jgi:hypothetical protein
MLCATTEESVTVKVKQVPVPQGSEAKAETCTVAVAAVEVPKVIPAGMVVVVQVKGAVPPVTEKTTVSAVLVTNGMLQVVQFAWQIVFPETVVGPQASFWIMVRVTAP